MKAGHHWQAHIIPKPDGMKVLEMPKNYILEMFCDWHGASRAQGSKSTVLEWYADNKDQMVLHKDTRKRVEELFKERYGRDCFKED